MQSIDDDAIATSVAAPGEGLPGLPLFLEKTEAQRAEKKFSRLPPPLISRSGSGLKQETMQSTLLTQPFAVQKDVEDVFELQIM